MVISLKELKLINIELNCNHTGNLFQHRLLPPYGVVILSILTKG